MKASPVAEMPILINDNITLLLYIFWYIYFLQYNNTSNVY